MAKGARALPTELNPFKMQNVFTCSLYTLKCMFLRGQASSSMEAKGNFRPSPILYVFHSIAHFLNLSFARGDLYNIGNSECLMLLLPFHR